LLDTCILLFRCTCCCSWYVIHDHVTCIHCYIAWYMLHFLLYHTTLHTMYCSVPYIFRVYAMLVNSWHYNKVIMFHTNTVRLLLWYPQSCHLYTLLHFLIFVTLHVITHLCICILCIAYILLYVYVVAFITIYVQHSSLVMLHTAYLHVHFHHVITIRHHYTTICII